MAEQPDDKGTPVIKAGDGWLWRMASARSWKRSALLLLSCVFILIAISILCGRRSYRRDPAALVPPSVSFYVEAKELEPLLTAINASSVWREERRLDRPNQLHADVASGIGSHVAGLGASRPLRWLSSPHRAAFTILRDDEGEGDSWALFIMRNAPGDAIAELELELEAGMRLEKLEQQGSNTVYVLSDAGGGRLTLGVIGPWLVLSSQDTLPLFALNAAAKTVPTLAKSKLLKPLPFSKNVRGMFDPAHTSVGYRFAGTAMFSQWVAENSRIAFIAAVGPKGDADVSFSVKEYTGKMGGGGFWSLVKVLCVLLGIAGLLFVLVAILALVKGSWLKYRAVKTGVRPAAKIGVAAPSAAFKEDAGILEPPAESLETSDNAGEERETGPADSQCDNESTGEERTGIDNVGGDTGSTISDDDSA